MKLQSFLEKLSTSPESINFQETIDTIDSHFTFTPCAFKNGNIENAENQNNGSCKIFAFAQLQNLDEASTLQCFGDYYRKDVLENPQADDHQNIRNFIKSGWSGISFTNDNSLIPV